MQADVAIVLGAAVYDDVPSPVLEGRILYAIDLYESGRVGALLFTGGKGQGALYSEAMVAKNYAIQHGILAHHILMEEQSTITAENLFYAKTIMQEQSLQTALIVSDPLHMKRAMLIADELHINVHSAPTPYSAYQSLKTKIPFFMREWFYTIGYFFTKPFR